MVTQLLSILDGVNELHNIFVIGMTNRKDLLDDALLRSGRLELHININLPDINGRRQILDIHTKKIRENLMFNENIDLNEIAQDTENFTGAELEALIKNASSYAINRSIVAEGENDVEILLTNEDMKKSLSEICPQFGNKISFNKPHNFSSLHESQYDETFSKIKTCNDDISSFLIHGKYKTTFLTYVATKFGIQFTKLISQTDVIQMDEKMKNEHLVNIFCNAKICDKSLILLDDLELLINYTSLRNTVSYSSNLFLTVQTILRKINNKKIIIIATTKCPELFDSVLEI